LRDRRRYEPIQLGVDDGVDLGGPPGGQFSGLLGMVISFRLGHVNKTIGIAEAKARLSEVIDRVESGETIIIARNGAPVAELRPLGKVSPEDAVKRIRAIGLRVAKRNRGKESWPPGGASLRDVAHDRHRF
jgi:prevent-host-death family protein